MIDHISIKVRNLAKSRKFYESAFKPLGYKVVFGEGEQYWAFDIGNGLFEIIQTSSKKPITRVHVAFRVKNKNEVKAFYKAALKAGGKDNGAPGPCPEYTPNYYASFILDPDGHNIEAMVD